MEGMDEIAPGLGLQEFCSQQGDSTIYYHLLNLSGSVYVWVGTEQGYLEGMVAALGSRLGPSAVTTLLGSSDAQSLQASHLAERLQRRTQRHILLSLNLPSDELIPHVEQRLLEELCVV